MPTTWRIVKSKYAAAAFDGEGARLHGGRWNNPGTRIVYTAQSKSLVILEILVHLREIQVLPYYSLLAARFEEDLVERLEHSQLPDNWRELPAPTELRQIGDAWVEGEASAVLEVPSAIVIGESNYLINPVHPDFTSITIEDPELFELDPRLL